MHASLQTPKASNQQIASQSGAGESEWQQYRLEDFCSSAAPEQVAPQDDDGDLQAAIEASKAAEAEAQVQEAFLAALTGGSSHYHISQGASSHEQSGVPSSGVQPKAHRSWFPFVHPNMEGVSHNGTAEGHGAQASAVEQEKASDKTYSDVMAFLLKP